MTRWPRVLVTLSRQGLHQKLAYRAFYWMQLVNTVVKVLALVTVWSVLYRTSPGSFPIRRDAMIAYAVMAGASAEFLTWWDGPHVYIANRIRLGTLTGDLLRPVYFPFQLFALWLGESAALILTITTPVLVLAIAVFGIAAPVSTAGGLLFGISMALSFILMYCLNFAVGLLVVLTLSLKGLLVTYHSLITLLSGFWVPLWFYPAWLRELAGWLPFRQLLYTPLSLYVGLAHGAGAYRVLAGQACWVGGAVLGVVLGWRLVRRHLIIQGG
jgi:ABC-2 type transport system permease protein